MAPIVEDEPAKTLNDINRRDEQGLTALQDQEEALRSLEHRRKCEFGRKPGIVGR